MLFSCGMSMQHLTTLQLASFYLFPSIFFRSRYNYRRIRSNKFRQVIPSIGCDDYRDNNNGLSFSVGNQYQNFVSGFHIPLGKNRHESSLLGIYTSYLGYNCSHKGRCIFALSRCIVSSYMVSICIYTS